MNARDAIPEDTLLLSEELIRTCSKHKVLVTGFVFSKDPVFVMQFDNIVDSGSKLEAVHTKLCQLAASNRNPTIKIVNLKEDA